MSFLINWLGHVSLFCRLGRDICPECDEGEGRYRDYTGGNHLEISTSVCEDCDASDRSHTTSGGGDGRVGSRCRWPGRQR